MRTFSGRSQKKLPNNLKVKTNKKLLRLLFHHQRISDSSFCFQDIAKKPESKPSMRLLFCYRDIAIQIFWRRNWEFKKLDAMTHTFYPLVVVFVLYLKLYSGIQILMKVTLVHHTLIHTTMTHGGPDSQGSHPLRNGKWPMW